MNHIDKLLLVILCVVGFQARAQDESDLDDESSEVQATAAEKLQEATDRLQKALESRRIVIHSTDWVWEDLIDFHDLVLKVMALDPNRLDARQIPAELLPENLTKKLKESLAKLSGEKDIAARFEVEEPFAKYLKLGQEVIHLREQKRYSEARTLAKKGLLGVQLKEILDGVKALGDRHFAMTVVWSDKDRQEFSKTLQEIDRQVAEINRKISPHDETPQGPHLASEPEEMAWALNRETLGEGILLLMGLNVLVLLVLLARSRRSPTPESHMNDFDEHSSSNLVETSVEPALRDHPDPDEDAA